MPLIFLGFVLAIGSASAQSRSEWRTQGVVRAAEVNEASGLAASARHSGWLWTHNDSGGSATIYAIDAQARLRARVDVDAVALDWEDIAAFEWRGRPYLAIADTGDNLAWRQTVQILLVPEPDAGATRVAPERVLTVSYPGGPRDVEAVAVDAARGEILLLEKRTPPARLYVLDLDGPDEQVAREAGVLPAIFASAAGGATTVSAWAARDMPTAMELDAGRRELLVMTYLQVLRFRAQGTESWADALARGPVSSHPLPRDRRLYEALAIDADGQAWALGEGSSPPLLRLPRPPEKASSKPAAASSAAP